MPNSSIFAKEDDAATASIFDSLSHMIEKDCTTYSCRDYLNESNCCIESSCCNSNKITPDDRMKVVDWCFDIVDTCQHDRDTVAVAINMADRFMSSQDTTEDILHHRGQYQLLVITALYLSIKINEFINEFVTFPSGKFAAITHDTYSREDIEDMEKKILHRLEWRLCVPTAQIMGSRILDLLELMLSQAVQENAGEPNDDRQVGLATWDFLRDELAFQTQNAVREYYFASKRCSTIAVVAILNAIEQVNNADYELLMKALICVLKKFDFDEASVLLEARHRLRCLVGEDDVDSFTTTRTPLDRSSVEEESDSCDKFCNRDNTTVSLKRRDTEEETITSKSSFMTSTRSCVRISATEDDDES
ncbi:hypothetical protein ACHAXR_006956 [Thalassiosira sp. AJA248-18]